MCEMEIVVAGRLKFFNWVWMSGMKAPGGDFLEDEAGRIAE
jgi:hypothetical protein